MANKYNMYFSFKLQDIETVSQLCTFAICSVYCSGYLTTYKDLHRKSFWQQSDLDMTSSDRNRLQNQIKTLNKTFFLPFFLTEIHDPTWNWKWQVIKNKLFRCENTYFKFYNSKLKFHLPGAEIKRWQYKILLSHVFFLGWIWREPLRQLIFSSFLALAPRAGAVVPRAAVVPHTAWR